MRGSDVALVDGTVAIVISLVVLLGGGPIPLVYLVELRRESTS